MNHQNKTEELKETIERIINDSMYYILDEADSRYLAEELIEEGYRKASEVAMEIFDEIERTFKGLLNGDISNILKLLSSLKKEYAKKKLEEAENRHVQCGELDSQPRKAV